MTSAPLTSYLQEQLAGLALCQVAGGQGLALTRARAAVWHNLVRRLGVTLLPLYWVHDFGLLLATPASELRIGVGDPAPGVLKPPPYPALLARLQQAGPIAATAALQLSDELIAAVLVRTCGELVRRLEDVPPPVPPLDLPVSPAVYASPELGPGPARGARAVAWLRLITTEPGPLHLQTAAELIDPDTLRLLSLSAGGVELLSASTAAGGVDLLDLLAVLQAPEARDIVRFSLELLPTVLETRRPAGAHSYPTGGYAALQNRGALDALVLSELASDEDVLYTRYALGDLLYYGREQKSEPPRRLHYVLVDASPSMRGLRQVFARGLALSLCKRLALLGGEVVVRFFDARLHEPVSAQRSPARVLPYVLGFRSQRGRNYGRVFRDLVGELTAQARASRARPAPRSDDLPSDPRRVSHPDRAGEGAAAAGDAVRGVHPAFGGATARLPAAAPPASDRLGGGSGCRTGRRARALAIVDDATAASAAAAPPRAKPGASGGSKGSKRE